MNYRADKLGDGRTDGLTDGQKQAMTIPEGQYWPRVKSYLQNFKYAISQCVIETAIIMFICYSRMNENVYSLKRCHLTGQGIPILKLS